MLDLCYLLFLNGPVLVSELGSVRIVKEFNVINCGGVLL